MNNLAKGDDGVEAAQQVPPGRGIIEAPIGQERNALAPFGNLPAELAIEILVRSLTRQDRRGLARIRQLASVHTAWWRLIKSHPDFWTHFHPSALPTLPLQLHKSGSLLMDIICWSHIDSTYLEQLKAHTHRWRSFTYGGSTMDLFQRSIQPPSQEWPLLEELRFDVTEYNRMPLYLPETPRLRRLTVSGAYLRLSKFSGLTSIDLARQGWYFHSGNLLEALNASPDLLSLRLSGIQGDNPPIDLSSVQVRPKQVQLPSLRDLEMLDVKPSVARALFHFVDTPNLMKARIQNEKDRDYTNPILEVVASSFLPSILENGTLPSISISITDRGIEILGSGPLDFTFFGAWKTGPWSLREDSLLFSLNAKTWIHLTIQSEVSQAQLQESIIDIPKQFSNITALTVAAGPRMIAGIAQTLGRTGSGRWSCPKLEELHVEGEWTEKKWSAVEEALALMVAERVEAQQSNLLPELQLYKHYESAT